MSKPKPSLAKKVVRSLSQHAPIASSGAPHALQLAPIVSPHQAAASGRREQLQAFRDLGLPAAASASWALSQALAGLALAPASAPSAAISVSATAAAAVERQGYVTLVPSWDAPGGSGGGEPIVQSYQPKGSRSPIFPARSLLTQSHQHPQQPQHQHQHLRHRRGYATPSRPISREAYGYAPYPDISIPLLGKGLDAFLPSLSLSGPSEPGQAFFQGNIDPPLPPSFPSSLNRPPTPTSSEEPHTSLSTALPPPNPSSTEQNLLNPLYFSAQSQSPHLLSAYADAAASSASQSYTSSLVFHHGASGLAKERPVRLNRPSSSRADSPPPRPRSFALPDVQAPASFHSVSVGEDAYFVRSDGMCVADGVGGWAKSGRGSADAGRWSRLLTHFCEVEVGKWWAGAEAYLEVVSGREEGWRWRKKGIEADSQGLQEGKRRRPMDPVEIMQRGFENCLACMVKEGIHGSSTCLLALLHHSTLHVANLGDSALLLVRAGEIVFRTSEMQHAFNFPLQLGTHSRDEPMKDARRYDVGVTRGDVVILGSDGLMDNLFDEEILETLAQFSPPTAAGLPTPPASPGRPAFYPQKVSEALCRRARQVSEETSATTPFMMKAIEEGIDFVGGKKDDISVVVGVIGDREEGSEGLGIYTR